MFMSSGTYFLKVLPMCPGGHTLCFDCKSKVNKCPICGKEIGNIRCLALEKLAVSLHLPCTYHYLGCEEMFPYYSKLKHEAQCVFRPYNCPHPGSDCSFTGESHKLFNCFGHFFCLHFEAFRLGTEPVYMAFLRFMGEESEARKFGYCLEVDGNGRKQIWQGILRSIRAHHRIVRDSHDGLIIPRSLALYFSGGHRKELKLRVTEDLEGALIYPATQEKENFVNSVYFSFHHSSKQEE